MTEIVAIFKEPFVQAGLISSLLLGGICAYLGIFLVLKRIVFVGAALSQLAAMGIALGHLLGHWIHVSPEVMAYSFALGGAMIFWVRFSEKKLSQESWIGFVYALAGSAAIVILAKDPVAEAENLDLMSGNLLFVTNQNIFFLAAVVLTIVLIHFFFHKEFLFISFDPQMAQTLKLPVRFYEFLLYLSFGLVVAVGIKMAGLLYVFSSLIVPAVIGLRLFNKLSLSILAAIISIFIASVVGILLSYLCDLPTAPTISTVNAVLFLFSLIFRK